MEGCAGPVIGAIDLMDDGRVLGFPACRMGETNGLFPYIRFTTTVGIGNLVTYGQRRLAMAANESTASSFSGQGIPAGSSSGRFCI